MGSHGLRTYCKRGHEFTVDNTFNRYRSDGTFLSRTCRICRRVGHNRRNRKYQKRHPDRTDALHRKQKLSRHGLTPEKYDQISAAQGHVCALCGMPETETRNGKVFRLSVDHNHATNEFRGLLCRRCNRMLGIAMDSIRILEKAIQYLRERP